MKFYQQKLQEDSMEEMSNVTRFWAINKLQQEVRHFADWHGKTFKTTWPFGGYFLQRETLPWVSGKIASNNWDCQCKGCRIQRGTIVLMHQRKMKWEEASGLFSLIGVQIIERASILTVSGVLWVLDSYQEGLCFWACAQTSRPPICQATKHNFCDDGSSGSTGLGGWIQLCQQTMCWVQLSPSFQNLSWDQLKPMHLEISTCTPIHMCTHMHNTQIAFPFLSKPNSYFYKYNATSAFLSACRVVIQMPVTWKLSLFFTQLLEELASFSEKLNSCLWLYFRNVVMFRWESLSEHFLP